MNVVGALIGAGLGTGLLLVLGDIELRGTSKISSRRLAAALGAGFVVLVVSRWPVLGAGTVVLVWNSRLVFGSKGDSKMVGKRTEALANWAEMLRDTLLVQRGLEGALLSTARNAPEGIKDELLIFADELELGLSLDDSLLRLQAELAHPLGDLVVSALRLAADGGAADLASLLSDLAMAAREEAAVRQRISAEREKSRAQLRIVVWIMLGLGASLMWLHRDFLAPYDDAEGQLVLGIVGGFWFAGLKWMSWLGAEREAPRFLGSVPSRTGAVS